MDRVLLWTAVRLAVLVACAACIGFGAYSLRPQPNGWLAGVAWGCACLSLAGVSLTYIACRGIDAFNGPRRGKKVAASAARHAALYAGVVAAILQLIVVIMRCVYVGIDLFHGYPWPGVRDYGFGPGGLWTLYALCAACGMGLLATRESRLVTVQFWLVIMLTIWACMLGDPFQPTQAGAYERTDATLVLVECLSCLMLVAVVVVGWWSDKEGSSLRPTSEAAAAPPGFRSSIAVLALAMNAAVMYHVLVPAGQSTPALRLSTFRAGVAAALCGVGCLLLLRRSWSSYLADSGLGLLAISACGMATLAVPNTGAPLAQKYPMIFNAVVVGYSLAGAVFAHLACAWSDAKQPQCSLRAKLAPHLQRFAFFSGATALLSGIMMCFWPGIPGISATDHSLGRVISGFAAFLFLLLVCLRASRLLERISFHLLTVAVAVSMVTFLVIRALPFASGIAR